MTPWEVMQIALRYHPSNSCGAPLDLNNADLTAGSFFITA